MANITASMVKELREMTGAGMMDCKNALVETDGNMDKAVDFLKEKGLAKAAKKAGRIAAEGLVKIAIADDNKKLHLLKLTLKQTSLQRMKNSFSSLMVLLN